jgi:hypothetical protein
MWRSSQTGARTVVEVVVVVDVDVVVIVSAQLWS